MFAHPSKTNVVGIESGLTATVVPAQVLITNTTTQTNGTECEMSKGARKKKEEERFAVNGNFSLSKFDC